MIPIESNGYIPDRDSGLRVRLSEDRLRPVAAQAALSSGLDEMSRILNSWGKDMKKVRDHKTTRNIASEHELVC